MEIRAEHRWRQRGGRRAVAPHRRGEVSRPEPRHEHDGASVHVVQRDVHRRYVAERVGGNVDVVEADRPAERVRDHRRAKRPMREQRALGASRGAAGEDQPRDIGRGGGRQRAPGSAAQLRPPGGIDDDDFAQRTRPRSRERGLQPVELRPVADKDARLAHVHLVDEFTRREPVVQRHEHLPGHRDRVHALDPADRVLGDEHYPFALNGDRCQRARETLGGGGQLAEAHFLAGEHQRRSGRRAQRGPD